MKIVKISLISTALLAPLFGAQELEKIVVTTPNKTAQTLQNVTSNIDIITSDEIEERDYRVLSDALIRHSGFSMSRNGGIGQSSSVYLRGFDSKRTLVLIDGVRYNDPTSLNGAAYEHLLLGGVDHIEIVKGAQSGIWGADASAGVINIITKKPKKDGVSASIHAEYGSYNTQDYGFNTTVKSGKFDLSLDLERLSSDGFSAKSVKGVDLDKLEDDEYSNNSYGARLGFDLSQNDRVETFFRYIDADTDFDGYDANATKAANDPISNATSKQKFYGVNYKRTGADYTAKLYYQRSDFKRVSTSAFGKTKFDGSIDESGINGTYKINSDLSLGGGADLKKFKHENKLNEDYSNKGVYLFVNNTVKEEIGDTVLSAVARYDNFDKFDNKTTYRFGFKHTPKSNPKMNYFANYSTGYNVPLLYQLFDPNVGNAKLNPEKTKGFDLGFNYEGFNLTYFSNSIEDMIDYKMIDPATYKGAYFNIDGKTTLKGAEISYSSAIKEANLAYNLNYTYLKTKDKNGKELPRRPKNSANLTLDYYGIPQTHLGATISYIGKRKKGAYDANPDKDYSAYTLVDLIGDYKLNDALNIYVKVENALDKSYENITGYGVSERAYYAGFRYKIK